MTLLPVPYPDNHQTKNVDIWSCKITTQTNTSIQCEAKSAPTYLRICVDWLLHKHKKAPVPTAKTRQGQNVLVFYPLGIFWFFLVDIQKVSMTGGVKHVILLLQNAVIAKQSGKDHHSRLVPVACFHSVDMPSLCSFHCV